MISRLKNLAATIDALGLRERLFFLLSAVGALFLAMDMLVYQPALDRQQHTNDVIETVRHQIAQLEQESKKYRQDDVGDPLAWRMTRIAELEAQGAALDTTIKDQLGLVIDPYQAAQMLRDILAQDSDLTLLELNTELVAQDSASADGSAVDKDGAGRLEQYQLTLRLEGTYLATLRFLQNLEQLPWALVSDEFDLAVEKHPRAQVTLKLYTLGNYGGAA
jgi:MSHA biogenesis protein MshJ